MDHLKDLFEILLNSQKLIHYGGFALLLIIIFAETGLVFGFIFPGDALLVTAGILCGTELLVNIWLLVFSVAFSAVVGNITGYMTGKYLGNRITHKKETLFFKHRHLEKSRDYYQKYGAVSLIGGRFIPVVRTFVPILAGAIGMNFWKFTLLNVTGALLWAGLLIPAGFLVGKEIPSSLEHLEFIVLGITFITMTILIRGYLKLKKSRSHKQNP